MNRRDFIQAAVAAALASAHARAYQPGGVGSPKIAVPSGFRWSSPPISLWRMPNGTIQTGFDPLSLIPAITKTYYVDPINGNDGNAGTSAAPLKNLSTALVKSDVDQVQIINLTADFVGLGAAGWNNAQPSRSVSVINRTGFRFVSTPFGTATSWPTWTVNGSFSNVYQTASTTTTGVTDTKIKSTPSYVNQSGATIACGNVPQRFSTLKKVASVAAVAATAGTWYTDGTNVYAQTADSRSLVGDTSVVISPGNNNGRFPITNSNVTVYMEGLDFVGGNCFWAVMASTVTGCSLIGYHCSFQGAANANGLNVKSFINSYMVDCLAADNWNDGFNYHSFESDGTTTGTSPSFIEVRCVAVNNGMTGDTGVSDNGSTCHDFCNGIRINCVYINTADRTIADIQNSMTWNLGCFVGPSLIGNTGGEAICAENSAQMWIDSCYAPNTGAFPRWGAIGSAVLKYFNSGAVTNSTGSTGTVQAYTG